MIKNYLIKLPLGVLAFVGVLTFIIPVAYGIITKGDYAEDVIEAIEKI